jgi:tetratricopeptide (TPR) repeat protein
MIKRVWMVGLVIVGVQSNSHACLRFLDDQPEVVPVKLKDALMIHEGRAVWEGRAKDRKEVADKQWDYKAENNLTVALVHIGQLDDALHRMQTVERVYPDQMETAYNLGTTYELMGDLPKAKFWIQEGIKRELKITGQRGLDGTEWLHLRILDAEMGLRTDPGHSQDTSVSGVDFGTGRIPQTPKALPEGNSGAALTLAEVQRSLQDQLHERLEFISAPNPVVGDLLFDLANVLAVTGNTEDALDIYRMALPFAPPRAAMAQYRFDYYAGTPNYKLIATMWSLALGAVGFYLASRKWREMKEWKAIPVQTIDDLGPAKRTAFIDFSKFDGQ